MSIEKTYSSNEDVENRLALGDHYTGEVEQIRDVRERAHRWIKHRFASMNKGAPDPEEELEDGFKVLKDIEADRAAYLYLRDLMEWASEPSSKLLKVQRWKKESEEMLEQLFRQKWGDELYAFSDG